MCITVAATSTDSSSLMCCGSLSITLETMIFRSESAGTLILLNEVVMLEKGKNADLGLPKTSRIST